MSHCSCDDSIELGGVMVVVGEVGVGWLVMGRQG